MADTKPTLWGDMDGVFAVYEHKAYVGDNPPFLEKGGHYFSTCDPDEKIIGAFQIMNDLVETHVITNLVPDAEEVFSEHRDDKTEWISIHMPFVKDRLHIAHTPKAQEAEAIMGRTLQKTDVLVSDFNRDLIIWDAYGGTAIKYLNGLNSASSWEGDNIPETAGTNDICNILKEKLHI